LDWILAGSGHLPTLEELKASSGLAGGYGGKLLVSGVPPDPSPKLPSIGQLQLHGPPFGPPLKKRKVMAAQLE